MNLKTTVMERNTRYRNLRTRPLVRIEPPAYSAGDAGITIRPGVPADAPVLARLGTSTFGESHRLTFKADDLTTYVTQALSVRRLADELADPHSTFLIAEVAGAVGGFVKLSASPPPACVQTPAPVEFSQLHVEPRFIGRAVGARLLNSALTQAARTGYATAWLFVWEGNPRTIEFYRNLGFRLVGLEKFQMGRSSPVGLVMARPVGESTS